jgi:uncharacterized protein
MGFQGILDLNAKKELLQLARDTISALLSGKEKPVFHPHNTILNEKAGAFVTLKNSGNLRGCIGNFSDTSSIGDIVQDMAMAAALEDNRFNSVTIDELDKIDIEISILSGLLPIKADDVKVGTHGLFITLGFHRGVLLPQVPVEWGWEKEEYLDNLCNKAGLPVGTWKEPQVKLESFTAQVFGEKE